MALAGGTIAAPVGASVPLPHATGTVSCSVKGALKFLPALTAGGTSPVTVTLATTLYGCVATGNATNIIGGTSKTSHVETVNDCLTVLTAPFQTSQGLLKWKVPPLTQKWAASTIQFTAGATSGVGTVADPFVVDESGTALDDPLITTDGSFTGDIATAHAVIKNTLLQIQAKCAAGAIDPLKGLKALNIFGPSTFTLT